MFKPETITCDIVSIGAWGPGFENWDMLQSLLRGERLAAESVNPPKPAIIPANERRRAPLPVKLAVETSWQASQQAKLPIEQMACVFASGLGDTEITDYMCRELTTEAKQLSPTKFHNSVHNAAAGYWTISTHCMQPANSIAGYHLSFSLSLLEAACQCVDENLPVLLTLFDADVAAPMQPILQAPLPFAASIVLLPKADTPLARMSLHTLASADTELWPSLKNSSLLALYNTNPAARILALLDALAHQQPASMGLPLADGASLQLILE